MSQSKDDLAHEYGVHFGMQRLAANFASLSKMYRKRPTAFFCALMFSSLSRLSSGVTDKACLIGFLAALA